MAELRRIRDEALAATEAGRAWIALFERAQLPLLTTLAEDERLMAQSAALVKRAAALTKGTRGRLRDEDVDAAVRFVRSLSKTRAAAEVRTDLRAVERRLETFRGLTSARALASLLAEPPRGRAPGPGSATRG